VILSPRSEEILKMITASHVRRAFGEKLVLKDVSLQLAPGALAGLIGPSGGGKSVLLKILSGVADFDAGVIDRGTINIGDTADVSLMFQEGALFDSINVFDNVAFPLVNGFVPTVILSHRKQREVHAKVEEILAAVGLSKASTKMPGQLSGGMRRRVSLARALVARPKLVLLDDPTSGLDPIASRIIMELIVKLHEQYKPTMLMVSQDLRRLLPVVNEVFALFDGRITFHGSVAELVSKGPADVRHFVACRYDMSREGGTPSGTARTVTDGSSERAGS
jgi:phospholipid/cholesterol/gamma-HCH transport system ATP-binding protein